MSRPADLLEGIVYVYFLAGMVLGAFAGIALAAVSGWGCSP